MSGNGGGTRFTDWCFSDEKTDSPVWGKVSNREWCEREAERINAAGGQARTVSRLLSGKRSEVCVFLIGRRDRGGAIVPRH